MRGKASKGLGLRLLWYRGRNRIRVAVPEELGEAEPDAEEGGCAGVWYTVSAEMSDALVSEV